MRMTAVLWVSVTLVFVVLLSGCPRKKPPPRQDEQTELTPPPVVDVDFVLEVFGAGRALANKPFVHDIDPRPGLEALIAFHRDRRDYQVAVVRGNREVLSQAPMGGKILANASINAAGEFRVMDLWGDGAKTYLMPVETEVYNQSVCGIIAFRYRSESLSVIGEFSTTCWRKEAGGDGKDPFFHFAFERSGEELRVITQEPDGKRLYRWDDKQQAFITQAKTVTAPAPVDTERERPRHRGRSR